MHVEVMPEYVQAPWSRQYLNQKLQYVMTNYRLQTLFKLGSLPCTLCKIKSKLQILPHASYSFVQTLLLYNQLVYQFLLGLGLTTEEYLIIDFASQAHLLC